MSLRIKIFTVPGSGAPRVDASSRAPGRRRRRVHRRLADQRDRAQRRVVPRPAPEPERAGPQPQGAARSSSSSTSATSTERPLRRRDRRARAARARAGLQGERRQRRRRARDVLRPARTSRGASSRRSTSSRKMIGIEPEQFLPDGRAPAGPQARRVDAALGVRRRQPRTRQREGAGMTADAPDVAAEDILPRQQRVRLEDLVDREASTSCAGASTPSSASPCASTRTTARCSRTRTGEQELCALREHARRGPRGVRVDVGAVKSARSRRAGRRRAPVLHRRDVPRSWPSSTTGAASAASSSARSCRTTWREPPASLLGIDPGIAQPTRAKALLAQDAAREGRDGDAHRDAT